jgi:hypothetical protein
MGCLSPEKGDPPAGSQWEPTFYHPTTRWSWEIAFESIGQLTRTLKAVHPSAPMSPERSREELKEAEADDFPPRETPLEGRTPSRRLLAPAILGG